MPIGMIFWMIMIIWFIFGLWWHWPGTAPGSPVVFGGIASHFLIFVLFFIVGWRLFGFVVQ